MLRSSMLSLVKGFILVLKPGQEDVWLDQELGFSCWGWEGPHFADNGIYPPGVNPGLASYIRSELVF